MSTLSKKERRARLLGILTLGAITTLAVTYVIAPRFNEPSQAITRAAEEVNNKIRINEQVALLQSQEASLDKVVEDLGETSVALPAPDVSSDFLLKEEIEELLKKVGLSPNSLIGFDTPTDSQSWPAVTNPAAVYDPKKAIAPTPDGQTIAVDMYQKPLVVDIQGPTDRLIQIVRRIQMLDRLVIVDSFEIVEGGEFVTPVIRIEARVFVMPTIDSPLVSTGTDDGTIDEVETLPNAPGA